MRSFTPLVLSAFFLCVAGAGCGGGDDATATEETPAASVETAQAEPEPEPIPLPAGFPEVVPLFPGMEITEAEVIDADKAMFRVVAATKSTFEDVLEHYEKTFREAGWAEDMSMVQEGMAIISASKDGFMVTVESQEGGLGCYITYTTGNL